MGFIVLVIWPGVKRDMKEKVKEAQRVFKG